LSYNIIMKPGPKPKAKPKAKPFIIRPPERDPNLDITAFELRQTYVRPILEDEVEDQFTFTPEQQEEFDQLASALTDIPYCPWQPTLKQAQFILDFSRESLFGGAVGGAKSIALMMSASMFLDVDGYDALMLRKTFMDLGRPGALMDIAQQWWAGKPGVSFNQQKHMYTFQAVSMTSMSDSRPMHKGATSRVEFGAMDTVVDKLKYQGGAWASINLDELTQFKLSDYTYMFSRCRHAKVGDIAGVPSRIRSTTNPGGPGHEWVHKRFIVPWQRWRDSVDHPEHYPKPIRPPIRHFHPSLLKDNPYLDTDDYMQSLMELDPVTRAQLVRGDWNIRPDGRMFKRSWFKIIARENLPGNCRWCRFWDMAATDEAPGLDPDYTVGTLIGRDPMGRYYIADVRRWRCEPAENDLRCQATANHDTYNVIQAMEQEPGASGKTMIYHFRRGAFRDTNFRGVPSSGKARGITTNVQPGRKTSHGKIAAASPLSAHANAGSVYIVADGSWDYEQFLSEMEIFPDGEHDDVCLSGDTLIWHKTLGPQCIMDVHEGDEVLGASGWVTVQWAGQTGVRHVIEGLGLTGTIHHPVFTDRGWVSLAGVELTDTLTVCNVSPMDASVISNPEVNTSNEGSRPYTKRSGRLFTGQSPLVLTSTTSTMTTPITGWRTWSASSGRTTLTITQMTAENVQELQHNLSTWNESDRLPPNGIAQKKDDSGTENTPNDRGLVPVFNLKTSDGTYFANGILVHNCDATAGALNLLAKFPPTDLVIGDSNEEFESESLWRPAAFSNIHGVAIADQGDIANYGRDDDDFQRKQVERLTEQAFSV
jgi:phage terminase large subunit-like protein